jgi:hypothetical protein
MERRETTVFVPGLVGGLMAGAAAAIWFLVVDLAAGHAFETPARLASVALGEEFTGPWPRLVLAYSVLHFGVFALVGIAAAYALNALRLTPGVVLGAVFGIAVLNTVHYGGLLITGTNLLTVVPVVHVLVANVLGGTALMAYLHRAWGAQAPFGWNVFRAYPVLYHGLFTGLAGAAAVAFWLFLVDVLAGRPFFTPAALGSALLLGASGPAGIQLNLGIVAAYSFLHIAVFVLVGTGFAWIARDAARGAPLWGRAAAGLVVLEGLFLGTLVLTSGWVLHTVGWFTIAIANVLAIVSMALWIWRAQRDPTAPPLRAAAGVHA